MTGPGRRVLVLSFDPLTNSMPGPAIRAWNLSVQLARAGHRVVLAGTAGASRQHEHFEVVDASGSVDRLVEGAEAVFAPSSVVRRHPAVCAAGHPPLCIDMSVPAHLENLEPPGEVEAGSPEHDEAVRHQVSVVADDLRAGDFFVCASDRQRDFWLGHLVAAGRVNPATYLRDPTMRDLIDVVPFGIDPSPPPDPRAVRPGPLRRSFPAIGLEDPVVIWAGGVYNWFDPWTLVEGVVGARRHWPRLRLVFLGTRHPNPEIPAMRVASALVRGCEQRDLIGQAVFFNDGWVPYDERGAWLADADVAASTHFGHLETRFSFRTRVLDHLWAGLPSVLTEGDTLSEDIASAGLGISVPPEDPDAVATALHRLLSDPPARQAVQAFGAVYRWDRVAQPLLAWCRQPWRAADRPA